MSHQGIPVCGGVDDRTAGEIARELYEEQDPRVSWEEVRDLHERREGAWFEEGETFCVAARLVGSTWTDEQIEEPGYVDPDGDELHVWVAVGEIKALLGMIPEEVMKQVKTMSFQRKMGKMRRYDIGRLTRSAMTKGD